MQKVLCLLVLLIIVMSVTFVDVKADTDDYKTFNEIIMSDGKLLRYYTDEELDFYKKMVIL